jgi:hypothetical protein
MLKKLVWAGTIIAVLTGSAYAQNPLMPSFSLQDEKKRRTPEEIARDKAIDDAYKSATKKIPEKQQANDPWADVRSTPPTPAPKNKQQ